MEPQHLVEVCKIALIKIRINRVHYIETLPYLKPYFQDISINRVHYIETLPYLKNNSFRE